MIRKGLVAVILLSMFLHAASRTGFLSTIYEQRHEIAYRVGLIAEIPIAMCSGDYDFNQGLQIVTSDDDTSGLPASLPLAREITLFFQIGSVYINSDARLLTATHNTILSQRLYVPPSFPIFHPPA